MRDKRTLEMTSLAMFIAIVVVMAMIPHVGFFQYGGGIAVTTLHIPVIIGTLYGGVKFGASLGIAFGVFSMIIAFLRPDSGNVIFQAPHIAIIPRLIFGLATWYLFVGLTRLIRDFRVRVGVTFALATLLHTVVTLAFIVIFQASLREMYGEFITLLMAAFPLNGLLEMGLAIVIGTPIAVRLMRSREYSLHEYQE